MCGGLLMEYCCFVTTGDDGEQRNAHGWIMKAHDKHDGAEYDVREGLHVYMLKILFSFQFDLQFVVYGLHGSLICFFINVGNNTMCCFFIASRMKVCISKIKKSSIFTYSMTSRS